MRNIKLTVTVLHGDKQLIEWGKIHAKRRRTSLGKLLALYLKQLKKEEDKMKQ